MKKVLATILTGAMVTSILIGCSSATSNLTSTAASNTGIQTKKKTQLVMANYRDIRDLNPHLYSGEMYAQNILYDGLIDMVEDGFKGALAESWEISEDGKTYTFHIRSGITFSNEEACDAYAIKANFDALIENAGRHVWTMLSLINEISAPDENTFVIVLNQEYYPLLTELSMLRPFAMVAPSCMIDGSTKDGVSDYIGTGPYVLAEFVTDEYAVFQRNELYWGEAPEIETILVKVIPDNQTRILALEKGEIDLIFGKNMVDVDTLQSYKNSERFGIAVSEPTSTRQIVLNTTNNILKDIDVRYALTYATNKQAISEGIFYGLEPVADTLYATSIPYCDIELKPFNYDMDKAVQILSDAGWQKGTNGILSKDGTALELTLLYNSDSVTEKTISEYLQSEYLKLGVKLHIKGEEEQSYRDSMMAGKFDMVFNICWGTPYDPQSSLSAMTAPVYGDYAAQLGLVDKAEIDEAINDIMVSVDETERQELFNFVLTRLHEDAVYITLTYECNKALYTSDLEGVGFTQSQYEIPFAEMFFK